MRKSKISCHRVIGTSRGMSYSRFVSQQYLNVSRFKKMRFIATSLTYFLGHISAALKMRFASLLNIHELIITAAADSIEL